VIKYKYNIIINEKDKHSRKCSSLDIVPIINSILSRNPIQFSSICSARSKRFYDTR